MSECRVLWRRSLPRNAWTRSPSHPRPVALATWTPSRNLLHSKAGLNFSVETSQMAFSVNSKMFYLWLNYQRKSNQTGTCFPILIFLDPKTLTRFITLPVWNRLVCCAAHSLPREAALQESSSRLSDTFLQTPYLQPSAVYTQAMTSPSPRKRSRVYFTPPSKKCKCLFPLHSLPLFLCILQSISSPCCVIRAALTCKCNPAAHRVPASKITR